MKKTIMMVLCMLLFSTQAMALQTCKATSITASTPTSDFVVNGNGTVTHSKTGLMWKRCSEGQTWSGTTCTGTAATYPWQGALLQANNLNTGGGFAAFTDWRVPNIKELDSIVEPQCKSPAINIGVFPATASARYWSASPYVAASNAWNVNFHEGNDYASDKRFSYAVRLVRGGQ